MDLLFKRYASPFILLDGMILTSSLHNFLIDFCKIVKEEQEDKLNWEYFLHKVFDESWESFISRAKPSKTEKIDLGATVVKSKNILSNFTPKERCKT